jgi:hypothetical protein
MPDAARMKVDWRTGIDIVITPFIYIVMLLHF